MCGHVNNEGVEKNKDICEGIGHVNNEGVEKNKDICVLI